MTTISAQELHQIARSNDELKFQEILSRFPDQAHRIADVPSMEGQGGNLLHLLVNDEFMREDIRCQWARTWVSHGADPNGLSDLGWSPLHDIFRQTETHHQLAKDLIELGANVNLRTNNGLTVMHLVASKTCDPDFIGFLINKGADMRVIDSYGNSVLNRVCNSRIFEPTTVDLLLNAGADPNRPNHDGINPLGILMNRLELLKNQATMDSDPEILRLAANLIRGGADENLPLCLKRQDGSWASITFVDYLKQDFERASLLPQSQEAFDALQSLLKAKNARNTIMDTLRQRATPSA